jgi:ribonuclease BN (tRNA processing enzyme)
MFKEYKTLTTSVRQQLQELGFEITEDGKHYRLTYYGDDRYKTTFSKTASDWREGKNMASTILKSMM